MSNKKPRIEVEKLPEKFMDKRFIFFRKMTFKNF